MTELGEICPISCDLGVDRCRIAVELPVECGSFGGPAKHRCRGANVDGRVVGPAAFGADDVSLFADVRKFRGGREVLFEVSYGFAGDVVTHTTLRTSHRRTDPERSLPHESFHPHTTSEPLRPYEVVTLNIALAPSATLFRAGEELCLDLQGLWFFAVNPISGQFPARWATSPLATVAVHTGGEFRSTLSIQISRRPAATPRAC